VASIANRSGSESAIGEPLTMLPPSVPTCRICGPPNDSSTATAGSHRSAHTRSMSVQVASGPATSVAPPGASTTSIVRSAATRDRSSQCRGRSVPLFHSTPRSVAPATARTAGSPRAASASASVAGQVARIATPSRSPRTSSDSRRSRTPSRIHDSSANRVASQSASRPARSAASTIDT
jgi:hypothetical protein